MSIEELKLIIDAIRSLSGETKEAFIWWLIVTGISPVVTLVVLWGGWLSLAAMVLRAVRRIAAFLTSESEGSHRLRTAGGYEAFRGGWALGDLDEACAILRAAKEKKS